MKKLKLEVDSKSETIVASPDSSQVKTCRICNDKASAFNFNGLSCESCKSFFRRNAHRGEELDCQKDGHCPMTIKTRKFCSKCRLNRCFEIGMKKELIYKRKQTKSKAGDPEVSFIKTELLNSFNTNPMFPVTTVESQFPALNSYEKLKIEEIVGYYQKSFREESTVQLVDITDPSLWMKNGEEFGKHLVRSIKNIPSFKRFSINDQLVLVKNFIIFFFDLRLIYNYEKDSRTTLILKIPEQDCCYRAPMSLWNDLIDEQFYNEWMVLVLKYKAIMMNDPIVRDLLITMALFRQHDQIENCSDWMRYKYLEHYYLLKRYIQVKLKNREKYEKHMKTFHKLLIELPVLIEYTRRFYKLVSIHYTNAVLEEIYENVRDD